MSTIPSNVVDKDGPSTTRRRGPAALTVRISHIPQAIAREQFFEALEAFVEKNTPEGVQREANIILSSFAPIPTSTDAGKSVATVTFRDIPLVLARGGPVDLGSFQVIVDSHFFGLTPLSNPTEDITVDIVAVTGLAGHAFGSWKSRSMPTMWLRDFLPEHVPTARILTYGYDSKLFGSESNASIRDFSGKFLETLKTTRAQEKEKHRPIILLGHSLGGLVIKQALVRAARGSQDDQNILLSCYSILFFGVPNRGLNIEAMRSMVKGQPNSRLVEDLDPESQCLPLLHEAFCYHFKFEDSPIISIYETMRTRTVVESARKGVWERTGPMVLMVTEASATYSGPTEKIHDQLSIDANHSDITKFSGPDNQDFLIIRQRIVDMAKKAPEAIRKRFKKDQMNVPDCTVQLHNRIRELLKPINFEADTKIRSWKRCEGTGDWLLSDPIFLTWRNITSSSPGRVVWLYGNPGCGKTYLMSMVLENIKEHLGHESHIGIAYFFCDNKTENPEKRTLPFIAKTLLAQLLGQIAQSYPADVELCLLQFQEFGDKDDMIPTLFQDTLRRIGKYFSNVFLIIDALDECDDVHSLLGLLQETSKITSTTFQIMLASRDIDSIRGLLLRMTRDKVHGIQISREQINRDVETFVRSSVRQLDIRDLGSEDEAAIKLVEGCDSLFLLAHYRIESLKRSGIHSHQDLKDALFALPDGLAKFYDKALKALTTGHERATARKIFMWVIYARRQLSFEELAEAVSDHNTKLTRRGLDELCGGLLIVKSQPNADTPALIELAHSTVKEYIFDFVWETTSPSPCLRDQNASHSEIILVSLAYMEGLQDHDKYPLLNYVYTYWIRHLFESTQPTSQFVECLTGFLRSENCFLWWDSPINGALNSTADNRRYLQSQFHRWITANTSDKDLQAQASFMTAQQEKQVLYRTRENGKEHISTLIAMGNLASTYWNEGRWKEAEVLQIQVLAAQQKTLGDDHPHALVTMTSLALTYRDQGCWKEAEVLQAQVVAAARRVLGEDHPEVLITMGNLALTYRYQGRWDEAEVLQLQTLAASKRILGEDHPSTLKAMGNLAATYRSQKRWQEAQVLEVQVVTAHKGILGEDHFDALTAMANLATTYSEQGCWEEAEALQVQILTAHKKNLGDDHPESLATMASLASTYLSQGRWKEAEVLQAHMLTAHKKVHGEDHPSVMSAMSYLALTYWSQQRWKEAEVLQVQVVTAHKRTLGEDHSDTLSSMANLALTYSYQGCWKEAEVLQVEVLSASKRVLGEDHPNTLIAMGNLTATYKYQGRWNETEVLQLQAFAASKRILGEDNSSTLKAMGDLASTYGSQGRWKEAEVLQVQVVTAHKRILGEDHPDALLAMTNLALTYSNQGCWKEAEVLQVQVVAASKRVLGEDHPRVLSAMTSLVETYRYQGRWEEAQVLELQVLAVSKSVPGEEPPSAPVAMDMIAGKRRRGFRRSEQSCSIS